MKNSRFSEEQIISILKQQESGRLTAEVCREAGISSATFYAWKAKFGGMTVNDAQRLRQLEAENAKLRRVVADQAVDLVALNVPRGRPAGKKMVRPAMKKQIAGYLRASHGLSQRKAASLVQSSPSVLRYQSKRPGCETVRARLKELAQQRPRFGYRRLHVLLRREGIVINRKKTHRLYREERLHLRPKRRRRITSSTRVAPEAATARNQLWIRPKGTRTSCTTTWPVGEHSELSTSWMPGAGRRWRSKPTPASTASEW